MAATLVGLKHDGFNDAGRQRHVWKNRLPLPTARTRSDTVINRGEFLAGEHEHVFNEIAATMEACGVAHLKLILETGELQTYDNVRVASDIAMRAGADFIKTSTGKISPAAAMPVTLVMLERFAIIFTRPEFASG